jgi:site-specific DNA-methyltransferase (adenine-specific)
MGTLYYGDNLDILQRYIKDESVDLVYLDPPFNSAQNYNAFFQEKDGTAAASQIRAFEDTWTWNQESQRVYEELILQPGKVSEVMQAFKTFLGTNDMMAYLAMMCPRLVELRRVLKPTGSLYLHCDPTASHYLKLLCDAVFRANNFRNDIIWKRRVGSASAVHTSKKFGDCYDSLLFYVRSDEAAFNPQYSMEAKGYQEYLEERFNKDDGDGRLYRLDNLANPAPRPNLMYEYNGYKPPRNGWAISREKMELWEKEGRLYFPPNKEQRIQRKRYLDEVKGKPVQTIWDDIAEINSQAKERLGYPTQKPVALLERIIKASSNPGGLVLDPFCGCGTTIDAAEKTERNWIGIDVTPLAINLIKSRLIEAYPSRIKFLRPTDAEPELNPGHIAHPIFVRVVGEPVTPADAAQLADDDKHHFQLWALGLVGARPAEQKKGADAGIDGRILFRDDVKNAKPEQIILSVKGGKLKADDVRALGHVVTREKAAIGVLISLNEPTGKMEIDAASVGFYEHKTNKQKYPRIQLRTVKELMEGKGIERPTTAAGFDDTFKKAPDSKRKSAEEQALPGL